MSRVTFAAILLSCAAAPLGGCNLTYDREAVEFQAGATIRPLSLGLAVSGTIATTTELDTYEFVVPAGGLQVRFQTFDSTGATCSGIDPQIWIYDAGMALLAASDDSGTGWSIGYCEDYSIDLPAGTHYVAVGPTEYSTPPFDYVLETSTGPYGGSLVTLSCDLPPATPYCEQITGTLSLSEVGSYAYSCSVSGTGTYSFGPCPGSTITGYCDGGSYSWYGIGTTVRWTYYNPPWIQGDAEADCLSFGLNWVP